MRIGVVVLLGALVASLAGSAHGAESVFRKAVYLRGFDEPVLLTYAPGEPKTVYVVEQPGRVLRVRGGRRTVFLDIRDQVAFGGEQGLLGLAFDPAYAKNRRFYIAYTSDSGRNTVVRYRSNGARAIASSRAVLLAVPDPYGNHNGGHLAFGPDRLLYTSIGDGGSGGDPENRAQNMESQFGKLLTLDPARPAAGWSIAALGLRNPWRFSFDRANGDLYIGDVGQGSIEEVNFTPRSSSGLENYGWDLYEGSRRFEDGNPSTGKLVFPVAEYDHGRGCSVTGGFVYRGTARRSERGRYVYGDYCSGIVWSFRIAAGEARGLRVEPFRVESLTSFGENAAGELFAVSGEGTIYRIS
ncbi:MAG TPA: PQQ-dependent sugar dehydrogenase [Gaiellaceae bacterium]|nr:PQQ-dependent sugar dehydrogenase [Gaiellaceae bacterium]